MAETQHQWQSPVDPTAPSALVSATHLIEFELISLETTPLTPNPDTGMTRDLTIYVDVNAVFKSDTTAPELGKTGLRLRQTGLDPMEIAPPPVIDPEALVVGHKYLLDAVASKAGSLNAIFAGARGVYPFEFVMDAQTAMQFEAQVPTDDTDALRAQLLSKTEEIRHQAHDLWGEYFLWHYRDHLNNAPRTAVAPVTRIALHPTTNPRLAITLLAEVDLVMMDNLDDQELVAKLGKAFLRALPAIKHAQVRHYLAGKNIHALVFDETGAVTAARDRFGADAETLAAAKEALADATDVNSQMVLDWLD